MIYDDEIIQELNGIYTYSFKSTENNYKLGSIIIADGQKFRITSITEDGKTTRVFAKHIFFDLADDVIENLAVDRKDGNHVLNAFKQSLKLNHNDLIVSSDILKHHSINISNKNALETLMKDTHSILSIWGGELLINNNVIELNAKIGVDTEELITVNKNIKSHKNVESTEKLVTRLYLVHGNNRAVVDSPIIDRYDKVYAKTIVVNTDVENLEEYGRKMFENSTMDLSFKNISIDVLDAGLNLNVGDTAILLFKKYNILKRLKVVKKIYKPSQNKIIKLDFGGKITKLSDELINFKNDVSETVLKETNLKLKSVIENSKKLIDEQLKNLDIMIDDEKIKSLSKAETEKYIRSKNGQQELIQAISADVVWLKSIVTDTEILNTIVANIDHAKIKDMIVNSAFINELISKNEFQQQFEDGGVEVVNIFSKIRDSITQSINKTITDEVNNSKTELSTQITQTAEGLTVEIEKLEEEVSDKDEIIKELQARLDSVREITASKEAVDELIEKFGVFGDENESYKAGVSEKIQAIIEEFTEKTEKNKKAISKAFRYTTKGLEISSKDSDVKLLLGNDKLSFYDGDKEVAYISNHRLVITSGVFVDNIIIGNHMWQKFNNVITLCNYVGGNK